MNTWLKVGIATAIGVCVIGGTNHSDPHHGVGVLHAPAAKRTPLPASTAPHVSPTPTPSVPQPVPSPGRVPAPSVPAPSPQASPAAPHHHTLPAQPSGPGYAHVTWAPGFRDSRVAVVGANGAVWHQWVSQLALLGCNSSRTVCFVQDMVTGRTGTADGLAIKADS